MTPAQLAAVSYLARYSGHTHTLYASQHRRWFAWCETHVLDPLIGIQRAHIDGPIVSDPAAYAPLPEVHRDESRTQGLDRLELIRFLQVAQTSTVHTTGRWRSSSGSTLFVHPRPRRFGVRTIETSRTPRLHLVGKGNKPATMPLTVPVLRVLEACRGERTEGQPGRPVVGPREALAASPSSSRCRVGGVQGSVLGISARRRCGAFKPGCLDCSQARTHSMRRTVPAALAAVFLLPAAPAAPAHADPPQRIPIDADEEFDFPLCGIDSHVRSVEQGLLTVRSRGPEGIDYFAERLERDAYTTNKATGLTIHVSQKYRPRDQQIVDNGDGTLTIHWQATFNQVDRAPDGSVAFRSAGRQTGTIVVDDGGTPSDPDDDEVISEEYSDIYGHDGREGTDFCAWYAAVTG
jgi:hypothetical protein